LGCAARQCEAPQPTNVAECASESSESGGEPSSHSPLYEHSPTQREEPLTTPPLDSSPRHAPRKLAHVDYDKLAHMDYDTPFSDNGYSAASTFGPTRFTCVLSQPRASSPTESFGVVLPGAVLGPRPAAVLPGAVLQGAALPAAKQPGAQQPGPEQLVAKQPGAQLQGAQQPKGKMGAQQSGAEPGVDALLMLCSCARQAL